MVQFYALSHLWWYFLQRFCSSLSQDIKIARHHHIVLMKFITKFEQSGVQFAKNFYRAQLVTPNFTSSFFFTTPVCFTANFSLLYNFSGKSFPSGMSFFGWLALNCNILGLTT